MFVKRYPLRGSSSAGKYSSPPPPQTVNVGHLRVGSYYEIDHSVLPLRSPEQLKSVRIVMVSKITGSHVSLRYPSMYSIRSHFGSNRTNRTKPERRRRRRSLLPVLDESHVVSSELAADLLYRRIAPHQVSMNRNSWSFWVDDNLSRVEGKCLSELKSGGMIKWGKRMRVRYQSRHKECSRFKEEEEEETQGSDYSDQQKRKRKLVESRLAGKETQIVVYKRRSPNQFIDRWSIERYKRAEKNMLKVMKDKNAVFGNPILRSELRLEARKLIGDTGLLDHLLKHMQGKVAPGGLDRFMRKHNADGAMEYWLESSDLVHLRKEAGVDDPFWTPPPGWKLGDSPTQDPICAGQFRDIRAELVFLKRELEKLASKKDEELAIMTTPNSCVTTQNVDQDNMMPLAKEIYADLLKKKYKIEDQLVIIAETLHKMEEDMGWLQKTVDENCPRKPDSIETPLLLEDSPMMKTPEEVNNETEFPQKGRRSPLSLINNTGFRICRPVASFSWPNLPALAAATDTDEIASLPSPNRPSRSSTTCPVKPFAAKRPLFLPFPFTATPPDQAPLNLFSL
ncbi:protein DYAD isoform X2 [Raphanus sativus]|nr:protein DYAD isoform X2 [Raphanus sativus]XP_056851182.1 protein DYAD isoform X2 [Raphanus sativus]